MDSAEDCLMVTAIVTTCVMIWETVVTTRLNFVERNLLQDLVCTIQLGSLGNPILYSSFSQ